MSVCKRGFRSSFISYFMVVSSLSSVLPTSRVFTSGYVNTENILHFFIQVERLSKLLLHLAYVSKISQVSPGDPILTQLCLQKPFRRVYLCILFSLKYSSYLEFQLQLGHNHIKSDRFTFRSRDFPMTLLHLGYVFQNFMLEYKIP